MLTEGECQIQEVEAGLFLIDPGMSGRYGYTSLFLVRGKQGAALLDSGVSVQAEAVVKALERSGVAAEEILFIALSHAHYDHAGGAEGIVRLLRARGNKRVRVACAEKPAVYLSRPDICEKLLRAGRATEGKWAGEMRPIKKDDFLVLSHGARLELGGISLVARDTPGHANGHLVFLSPELAFLFAGDACGLLGRRPDGSPLIAPAAFAPEYRHQLYLASLRQIGGLRISKIGLAHFGILKHPAVPLLAAAELCHRFHDMVQQLLAGKRDRDSVIHEMETELGTALRNLYPDPSRLRLTIKSMIAGFLHDLQRTDDH